MKNKKVRLSLHVELERDQNEIYARGMMAKLVSLIEILPLKKDNVYYTVEEIKQDVGKQRASRKRRNK